MSAGLIVPAGSPLVQFEIERYADSSVDQHLPCRVWVDARNPLRPADGGIACHCAGPFYPIRHYPAGIEAITLEGHTASVCLCMGRFIKMIAALHQCAAPPCRRNIEPRELFCFRHWAELPVSLRGQFGACAVDAPEELKAEAIAYMGRLAVYWDGLALRDQRGVAVGHAGRSDEMRALVVERLGARIVGRPR